MRSIIKTILILLLAVLFIYSIWSFNIKVFLADAYYRKVVLAEQWPDILENYKKVLSYQPYEPYYQGKFARALLNNIDSYKIDESKIKILNMAIQRIKMTPYKDQVFENKMYLARIYAKKADITQDENDFLIAEDSYNKLKQIRPKMAGIYNDWCKLKINKKQMHEAEQMCNKALSLYPDLQHPQLNEEHRIKIMGEMSQVYEKLGDIYFINKDYNKAESMYIQVLKFFPMYKIHIWNKIADIYYMQGDIKTAIEKNMHGYILNPKDSAWSSALYLLYKEIGDTGSMNYWKEKYKKSINNNN